MGGPTNMSMGEVLSTLAVNMLRSGVDWESEPVLVLLAASICGHDHFMERAHEMGFGPTAERVRDALHRSVQPVTVFQCAHGAQPRIDTGTGASNADAKESSQ